MQAFIFRRAFIAEMVLCVGIVAWSAFLSAALIGFGPMAAEGGPLERGQEIILAMAALIFGACAMVQRRVARMASAGAFVLAVVMLLRELEIAEGSAAATYFNSPWFRIHEAVAIAVAASCYVACRWRLIGELFAFVRGNHAWPFAVMVALLVVGDLLDGGFDALGIPALRLLLEETVETAAYALYALIGATILRRSVSGRREVSNDVRSENST